MRDRESLIARIRQLGRARVVSEKRKSAPPIDPGAAQIRDLEARVAHLEQLVEGFQDSVHRESARHARLIAELQTQVQPSVIGAALSKEARDRGL